MGFYKRISNAFEDAPILPLNQSSRYVMISDCHRGIGTWSDNFLKNQHLYFAALEYYYKNGFTYIELGDGDELWENRNMSQIIEIHDDVFRLLSRFLRENRLYMIYGNHDIIKRNSRYTKKHCSSYYCNSAKCREELFSSISFHQGIILKGCDNVAYDNFLPSIYLTHGHQADFFNSTLWRVSRFLVRYLWTPLERFGVLDPTSAAKNNTVKKKTERKLSYWAENEGHLLMTGHTHRPMIGSLSSPYFNTGSCVHPRCITCIEIMGNNIFLVKWTMAVKKDYSLYVSREILERGNLREFKMLPPP
ncbi:MAG: metallophosphoesterase [Lachnospiraceae bacterium]